MMIKVILNLKSCKTARLCVYVNSNRTPGNKPGSSPRGHTPDETGRRHDANSSVSDLANSVTSDMLMVTHNINTVYL